MRNYNNKLVFLGTGTSQGVPVIGSNHPVCLSDAPQDKRLRSSVMVHHKGQNLLIDCGPDFRQQMLRAGLDRVDAILITHEHNDHIIGLDDVRPLNFKYEKDMPIYAMPRVIDEIKTRFPYVFALHNYPGLPAFDLNKITAEKFNINQSEIIPLPILHGKLPILGYRIGNLAYITDVSHVSDDTLSKLENLEILVVGALRKEPRHHSHFTLGEAIEMAQKVNAGKTYFTHISHLMGFHNEVEKELPSNMHLAYDGLELNF